MKKALYLACFLGIVSALAAGALAYTNSVTAPIIAERAAANAVDMTSVPDGTYTGTGKGFGGDVTAEVTIEGGVITSVTLSGADETPTVGQAAFEGLQQAFVDAQSESIDAVSGATYTSNGAMEAVSAALKSALQ